MVDGSLVVKDGGQLVVNWWLTRHDGNKNSDGHSSRDLWVTMNPAIVGRNYSLVLHQRVVLVGSYVQLYDLVVKIKYAWYTVIGSKSTWYVFPVVCELVASFGALV